MVAMGTKINTGIKNKKGYYKKNKDIGKQKIMVDTTIKISRKTVL